MNLAFERARSDEDCKMQVDEPLLLRRGQYNFSRGGGLDDAAGQGGGRVKLVTCVVTLCVLLLGVVIASAMAISYFERSRKQGAVISDLLSRNRVLESGLKSVQEKNDRVEVELKSMRSKVDDLHGQREELEARLANKEGRLANQQAESIRFKEEAYKLKRQNEALQNQNGELAGQLERAKGEVEALRSELSKQKERVESGNVYYADSQPSRPSNSADRRCSYCNGTGTANVYVKCTGCGGMKYKTGSLSPCPDCDGRGRVLKTGRCSHCRGTGRR